MQKANSYEKLTKQELLLILKATKKELAKTKKELAVALNEADDYKARTIFWYKKANRALFKLNYNTKCLKMFNDLCEKYTNTYKEWAYFE